MTVVLPLMKNVLTPLIKNISLPLGATTIASASEAAIQNDSLESRMTTLTVSKT